MGLYRGYVGFLAKGLRGVLFRYLVFRSLGSGVV